MWAMTANGSSETLSMHQTGWKTVEMTRGGKMSEEGIKNETNKRTKKKKKNLAERRTQSASPPRGANGKQLAECIWYNKDRRAENNICVFSLMAPVQNVIYCCIFFNEWNGRACASPQAVLELTR